MVNRTMHLLHVTSKFNWYSIAVQGLQKHFSGGMRDDIWLVTPSKIGWAINHVAKRYDIPENELIVVFVRVRRDVLRKSSLRGVWRTSKSILPVQIEDIMHVSTYMEFVS